MSASKAQRRNAPLAPQADGSLFQLLTQYPNEQSAEAYFAALRWPDGRYCPKCSSNSTYDSRTSRRLTTYKCATCEYKFTVTSGTVMEGTHLSLRHWLFAFRLIGGSKHGISSRALARHLGITLKSAWHLSHRIRATMKDDSQFFSHGIVEADETYIGGKRHGKGRGYRGNKMAVMTIVERDHGLHPGVKGKTGGKDCEGECPGRAQTIALQPDADKVDGRTVSAKLRKHTDPETTHLMTDESNIYGTLGKSYMTHDTVNHAQNEYVRIDPETGLLISTNTAEGLFGNLKRQIQGTHHSTSKKHLPKYLEEYDYKYNNRDKSDVELTEGAMGRIGETKPLPLYRGKRGGEGLMERPAKPGTGKTVRGLHSRVKHPSGRKGVPSTVRTARKGR